MTELYNADCLEVLKNIPDNSIDLVVTDCPYHIVQGGCSNNTVTFKAMSGIMNKQRCSQAEEKEFVKAGKIFKHNEIEFKDWLPEIYRVLKQNSHCYIMINGRNLKELQVCAESISKKKKDNFQFVNLLAWKKNNMTPNKYYMQQLEFILLLRKGKARNINNMGTSNCLEIPNIIGKKKHPTEKPVDLMQIFIENSSNVGDTVLDLFMGAGSTGVACINTNRNFIGIEIDKEYFDIAKQRIEGVV